MAGYKALMSMALNGKHEQLRCVAQPSRLSTPHATPQAEPAPPRRDAFD